MYTLTFTVFTQIFHTEIPFQLITFYCSCFLTGAWGVEILGIDPEQKNLISQKDI